jgi:hypothetical protein
MWPDWPFHQRFSALNLCGMRDNVDYRFLHQTIITEGNGNAFCTRDPLRGMFSFNAALPACHNSARQLPEHQQSRYLASRALLAEMMLMLYGISELPTS